MAECKTGLNIRMNIGKREFSFSGVYVYTGEEYLGPRVMAGSQDTEKIFNILEDVRKIAGGYLHLPLPHGVAVERQNIRNIYGEQKKVKSKAELKSCSRRVSLSVSGTYGFGHEQNVVSFGYGVAELLGVSPNVEYFEIESEDAEAMHKRLEAEVKKHQKN